MNRYFFISVLILVSLACGKKKDEKYSQQNNTQPVTNSNYNGISSTEKPPVVHDPRYTVNTSEFRPELQKHLDKLASEGELPSQDTIARNYLRDKCTKDELIQMMNCEDQLLRVIAFRTIVNRNEIDFFPILVTHLGDTAKILWWFYDDACGVFSVADMCLDKVRRDNKLTRGQKDTLIYLVLTQHEYLNEADFMIKDIEPQEKYYSLIKKKAEIKTERCGDRLGACYALAKFRKQSDVDFLYKIFKDTDPDCMDLVFMSIEMFPDKEFFPILTDYFENQIKRNDQDNVFSIQIFCYAVAKYKTNASLKILTALTQKDTYPNDWYLKSNKRDILAALHQNMAPIYNDLYKKLKSETDTSYYKYLDLHYHNSHSYEYW